MEIKTIRTGIVGSGFSASFHMEALKRVYSARVEVVGVFSPTRENRDTFATRHGIKSYTSLEELIADVDIVHVCTPPVTHEPVAVSALNSNKYVIIEKPFTGYFGTGSDDFNGDTFPRETGLGEALGSVQRIREAEAKSTGLVMYAENWVYAPVIQKEAEILRKTGAQILWMHGEESHSGSHSAFYGIWKHSGGGSIMGKSVHPLTAALYLKRVEGIAKNGKPIRPASVSARTHAITRHPNFKNEGHLRDSYTDIEDFGAVHVVFQDGTFADIFASEIVMGGVHNYLEVNTTNHRAICNINPNTAMQTYNPLEENFNDIYVVEKTGTKQGWAFTSPDEDWFTGYQHEMEAFYRVVALGESPESGTMLGADVVTVVYGAYLSAERRGQEVDLPLIG